MTFLCMIALRNKTVAITFLQSFKRTLTVSVKKDCRDPENLLPWECDVTLLLSIGLRLGGCCTMGMFWGGNFDPVSRTTRNSQRKMR